MAEYGGSPNGLAETWTPGQMLAMAERIRRRRAGREADLTESIYAACLAAQNGKDAFRQFRRYTADLRRQARGPGKRRGLAELAKAMGLKSR